jgi:hypothetical protein
MPSIEDLQPFIADLNSLGHEPELLARNGETLEPVTIPEEGLTEKLKSLLQSSSPPASHKEAKEESGPSSPENGLDFSSVPDMPERQAGPGDAEADNGFPGLDGDMGISALPGGLDAEEDTSAGTPDAETGDAGLEALLADFPGLETPPEEPSAEESPQAPAGETEEPASSGESDGFPAWDDEAKPRAPVEEPPEAAPPPEEPAEDPFELPESTDDFLISDIEDEPSKSRAAKSAAGKAEESVFEAPEDLGDFSFPGMDTPDLGEEPEAPSEEEQLPAGETEEQPVSSEDLEELLADFPDPDGSAGEGAAEEGEVGSGADSLNLDDFEMPDFSGTADKESSFGGEDTNDGVEDFEDASDEEFPEALESPDGGMGASPPDELDFGDGIELQGEEGPLGVSPADELPVGGEEISGSESAPHDEFSLGDFGAEFGVQEDLPPDRAADETEINIPEGVANIIDSAAAGAVFTLSDEEFTQMQETLQSLPLNIKIVVEELVGDQKADEAAQMNLIRMLAKGASVKSIAAVAGKLIGRTLVIPRGYEKSSGTTWEAEKGSFAYFLRETFLPVFKIASTVVLAAALLGFLGYRFVYKPIYAHVLLSRGYEMAQEERFRDANALFAEGYREWPFKEWYFRYAEEFIRKKQYQLAREKYEQLIGEYDDYLDEKGIRREREKDKYFVGAVVEYARFESLLLENFEAAEKILRRLLDADMYNYEGLLESGDNYIRWAQYNEERFSSKYEEARRAYATAMDAYGENDEILFRFLDVFIHMDNRREVLRIKNYFAADPKKAVDPVRYAELGGYLLDKNESVGEVRDILFRALADGRNIPDIHYHFARFYNKREEARDERLALDNAIHLYAAMQPITRKGLWRLVDSYGRSGELFMRQKSFLEAEGEFKQGAARYEDGVKKTLIKKDAALGRIYSRLGDIYYYQSGDLEAAYAQFVKAEDSLVTDPGLYYKKGFIRYAGEDYAGALREFTRTEEAFPSSRNLLFALGNANYMRNNFSVAEGYYAFLTERLEADRRRIAEIIPEDRASDRALILNLIKAYNNLGVILYKMGERTGSVKNTSRALVLWTTSTELAENYARDRETLVRRDAKNLAYLNLRQILNPLPGYELQIYQQLPRDMAELFF